MTSLSTSPPDGLPRSASYQPGDPLFAHPSTSSTTTSSPFSEDSASPLLLCAPSSSQSPSPTLVPFSIPSSASAPAPASISPSSSLLVHSQPCNLPPPLLSSVDEAAPPPAQSPHARLEGVPEEGVTTPHVTLQRRRSERGEGETHRPSSTKQLTRSRPSGSSSTALTAAGVSALLEDHKTEGWQKLMNLKSLLSAGFITRTEYRERKSQLIDEMTGTTLSAATASSIASTTLSSTRMRYPQQPNVPVIVPRGPPDFSVVLPERATKYTFDLATRQWNATKVLVKLDPVPFSRGALRLVYHLQDLQELLEEKKQVSEGEETPSVSGACDVEHSHESSIESDSSSSISAVSSVPSTSCAEGEDHVHLPLASPLSPLSSNAHSGTATYVAKISMDPRDNEDREIYFRDVEMQTLAKYYAHLFNEYQPPKLVDFVKASILLLEEREGQPLCGVERYIEGTYRKWNNNFGFVSEDERNTPQAFSHFTYESSNHRLLICDIQGVSDSYTDPQVHSIDGDGFGGKGNLGQRGIDRFLQTHRCNAICRYLKLPSINANYSDLGTLPVTQYMSYEQVKVVNIHHFPRSSVSQQMMGREGGVKGGEQSELTSVAVHGIGDMEDQHCKGFCTIL